MSYHTIMLPVGKEDNCQYLEIKKNLIQIIWERKRTSFIERRTEIQNFPFTDVSVIPCFGKFPFLLL